MWPFDKHTSRRREIRRDKVERGLTLAQQLRERIHILPVMVAALSASLAALILNVGGEPLGVHPGQRLHRAMTARVEFRVEDVTQTRLKQARARESSPNFYRLDASLIETIRGRLTSLLTLARSHGSDAAALREAATKLEIVLDDDGVAELADLATRSNTTPFEDAITRALRALTQIALVEDSPLAQRQTSLEAVLVDPGTGRERTISVTELLPTKPETIERVSRDIAALFPIRIRESVRLSLSGWLNGPDTEPVRPLYRLEPARTAQVAESAMAAVEPQFVTYPQHALLADSGIVLHSEIDLLRAERAAFLAARATNPEVARTLGAEGLGRALLAVLVTVGLVGFVYRFKPRNAEWPVRQVLTALLLLGLLAAARAAVVIDAGYPPHVTIAAQAIAAAVLSIVYARVVIFGICGGLAVLLTLAAQQGIEFVVTLLAISGTFVFALRAVRNRGQIVGVGLIAGLVAFGATTAAGVMAAQPASFVLWQAAWAACATVAAAFLVEGALPGIERAFGISTNMTLLEWCDANKPLMRMMAAEAPGTYNHSLLVGALAEAAAEAVGANGLLARAGAYYHDIGKINKPEYFVENQPANVSRHERLSPAMSVLVIVNHVKDGIEMAREYGVPPILRSFIAEHHGTTLVEYFYHQANRARKPGDPDPVESEFRYPGPKPESRESAIVMLCDGVEGAVRAMTEPTPGRIESVVSEITRKRLLDGQLDECDLNFRELAVIEKTLLRTLCAIYHSRIEYPDADERERPDRTERERPDRRPREGREPRAS
ncbi:MAG: HDIG domain-containing protein [Phycisphaerales bacterium]|nr:HDIG domain-containing protein [Phycisphaerales bacterium]